jgi:hypothetical protein
MACRGTALPFTTSSIRNGNLEVKLYFLKAKQGYIVRKMEEDKWM